MRTITAIFFLMALPAAAAAEEDAGGQLNPPEMGVAKVLDTIRNGETDMVSCASGYFMTKAGNHGDAREVFEACAEAGWTATMTWMSQLDANGLGADHDPDAAADWSRRAAEAGDPVGQFNYGLALIRGHGVARNVDRGKRMIDMAASAGLGIALRLKNARYDLSTVTPDADEWKFRPTN